MTNSYMKESDTKSSYGVGYFLAVKTYYYNKKQQQRSSSILNSVKVPPGDILLIPLEVLPG